jgi:hypothetical protein
MFCPPPSQKSSTREQRELIRDVCGQPFGVTCLGVYGIGQRYGSFRRHRTDARMPNNGMRPLQNRGEIFDEEEGFLTPQTPFEMTGLEDLQPPSRGCSSPRRFLTRVGNERSQNAS